MLWQSGVAAIGHLAFPAYGEKGRSSMKEFRLVAAAIACVGVATFAQADPNMDAGKALAADKCDECHAGGQDKEGDSLKGIPADKIVKALQEYKAKTRKHGGMRKRAGVLSDQDMEDVAAYYAAQPKK